jgi:hypothetical protein
MTARVLSANDMRFATVLRLPFEGPSGDEV